MRGRGLKSKIKPRQTKQKRSPPMRGRGLKLPMTLGAGGIGAVAPYAGAWIEITDRWLGFMGIYWSPPMRGRGLKSMFTHIGARI